MKEGSSSLLPLLPVEQLDQRASEIVLVVQKCTESLRNVKEYATLAPSAALLWTAVNKSNKSKAVSTSDEEKIRNINNVIANTDLYAKLVEDGVLAEVVSSCNNNSDSSSSSSSSNTHTNMNSRAKLSREILLPIAKALSDCYNLLDQVPTKAPESLSTSNQKKKQQPPPPPAGMLSLQNYTDIGAFLEFWVCTSILPFLEPCILSPVEDRARYFLPNSLAGRISRPSLLWGCRQQQQLGVGEDKWEFLQLAVQELQQTVVVLGEMLLLDRFRPMLLPRHLADLYAAIFQSEAYSDRIRQLAAGGGENNDGASNTEEQSEYYLANKDFQNIVSLLLPGSGDDDNAANKNKNTESPSLQEVRFLPVDPGLQAQALQALLLQGTRSPIWLRRRVSRQLTDIALRNLSVIVQVFVHAAPPKDKTAASMRLAQTLLLPIREKQQAKQQDQQPVFYDLICQQLILLLDNTVNESIIQNNNNAAGNDTSITNLTSKQTMNIHTVWAIMDQLPQEELQKRMLPLLAKGLLASNVTAKSDHDDTLYSIHQSVKRIAMLLSSMSPSFNPSNVAQLFLTPLQERECVMYNNNNNAEVQELGGTETTLLVALVRLASIPPLVIKTTFHDDAVWATRTLLHVIIKSKFKAGTTPDKTSHQCVNSAEVAAMALVYSLAPSDWDLSGYSYAMGGAPLENPSSLPGGFQLDSVVIKRQEHTTFGVQDLVSAIQGRVEMAVKEIIAPLLRTIADDEMQCGRDESKEGEEKGQHPQHASDSLPSKVFHLALSLYFTAITASSEYPSKLPVIFKLSSDKNIPIHDFFKIISMCILPLMCEKCPPESLLMGSDGGGVGIFQMMQLAFTCAVSYFSSENILIDFSTEGESSKDKTEATNLPHDTKRDNSFQESGIFLSTILAGKNKASSSHTATKSTTGEKSGGLDSADAEMVLSVTSLLLSLLIAILELGTKARRLDEEEAMLGSFTEILRPLAEVSDQPWSRNTNGDTETAEAISVSCAEIAEMAAHAMALVGTRKAPQFSEIKDEASATLKSPEDIIKETFKEAENDLRSTQPPIRAKGVVSLQRMLRGSLLSNEATKATRKPFIVEVDDEKLARKSLLDRATSGVLRLSVSALSDSESYVYLAAVQSIVAAVDLNPSTLMPLLGSALASGVLNASEEDTPGEIELTSEQLVKLAEAMVFCIRRRARIDEFITTIMDLMIFGGKRKAPENLDAKTVDRIQKETNEYFLLKEAADDDKSSNENDDLEQLAEKQNLRINSGGPLFRSEETDVVTASRITVVSELVAVANPSVLSRYCTFVTHIVTNSLRLESSRPVRRAAAYLAREIYRSLLRECHEMFEIIADGTVDSDEFNTDLSLATAMVSSKDDEVLAATLRRCLTADDLEDTSKSKYRLFDAATVARCEEALGAREEAVDGGLLVVAQMILESKELDSGTPAKRVIQDFLKQQGRNESVKVMKGLKIDAETLELK